MVIVIAGKLFDVAECASEITTGVIRISMDGYSYEEIKKLKEKVDRKF